MTFRFKVNGKDLSIAVVTILACVVIGVGTVMPLWMHIWWCLTSAPCVTWQALVLAAGGLVLIPIGWLHGIAILFGPGGMPLAALC